MHQSTKIFHHYVKDKDGNIEMEIFYQPNRHMRWGVHYPRFEAEPIRWIHTNTCFTEFMTHQVCMLVFAYGEDEFHGFVESFEKWSEENARTGNGNKT